MNLGEIKTRVKRQFGDESGAQITDEDIVRWANDGQLDINRQTEILIDRRETDAIALDGSYSLPTNYMFMKRLTLNGVRLRETPLDNLDNLSNSVDLASATTPWTYYRLGEHIFLHPNPSTGGTLNLDIIYVRRPETLINDADVPEIPLHMHEDLVRFALARAKELDGDYEGAGIAGTEYADRITQARHEFTTQPLDSFPAVRLLPGDD